MAEEGTPELVELVRAGAEAFNRRDLDAGMRLFAPDAVYDTSSVGIGTFEGADAIRRHLSEWFDNYEEYEFRLEEVHDLGNEVTFEVVRHHGRLAASDAAVQERWSYTALWEAGVISRMIVRADIDEARAAAERLAQERGSEMTEDPTRPDPVQSILRALEADGMDVAGFVRFFAPDAVFLTGVGRFEGRDAIRRYCEDFHSAYDELSWAPDEVHDLGHGVAWFTAVLTGRLRATSPEVHLRFAVVVTHTGGLVLQWTDYVTIDEARAAAERLAQERADG